MLISAIFIFALAALLGLYLLSFVLRKKDTPKGVAFTHGPLGAIGIVILLIYSVLYTPKPIVSLIIFIIAALGGFVLIYRDLTGKTLPRWLAITHGSIAVIGFLTLLIFAFTK